MTLRTKLINRRYRLERRVSVDDMTETWLGFDNVLHRAVCVTLPRQEMLRSAPFLVEFLQRSRIATALHHRGIVAAFDSGEDGDLPYLIGEYLGGDRLTDIIRNEAPFDVDDVAILVEQAAAALDYAHQRGFVHGSLGPEDIIVDAQGVAKIVGLGVPAGTILASPDAFAHRPLSVDDDIRALAAVAFTMVTGEEFDHREPYGAYQIDPAIPRNASDIVAVGLSVGTSRFTSAGAFARALRNWRTFDPSEFLASTVPTIEVHSFPEQQRHIVAETALPDFAAGWMAPDDERAPHDAPLAVDSTGSVRLAFFASLLLAAFAMALVWNSAEPASGTLSELPEQVELLAQLSGF